MIKFLNTPAEMLAEAELIDSGKHPFFGPETANIIRRMSAQSLRLRAAALQEGSPS